MSQFYERNTSLEITSLYVDDDENKDLRAFAASISIFEDMFAGFMSAQILINDFAGVYDKLKLQGWEKVTVGFKTNAKGDFDLFMKEFRIYKIGNGSDAEGGTAKKSYMLYLISEQAYNDLNNKISRSFVNMKESDVVKSIAENILKVPKIEIEPSKFTKSFVVPNWSPMQTIQHMCTTAVRSGSYESVNFMFYENIDSFYFVSLDKLMEAEVLEGPLTYLIAGALPGRPGFSRQVKRFRSREAVDLLKNANAGVFGTTHIGVDMLHKKIQTFTYEYEKEFENQINIDQTNRKIAKQTPKSPEQRVVVTPFNSKVTGGSSDFAEKHISRRVAMMNLWNNYVIEAEIEGDTSLRIGSKVEVQLPSYDQQNPAMDEEMSGNYLITAIHHYFISGVHNQVLTLRKPMLKGSDNE